MTTSLAEKVRTFDPDLPLERAHTIPACWYRDADVHEAERRAVFGRTWLAAGRAALVSQPGTFLTADVAGEPILVVRDGDGTLRAFANVCRHRAAPVMTEPCGTATRLRCRYHGWTYDLAGRLRGAPEFDGVADFCREDNGLVPLAVDTWGPFVWVHAGVPSPSLAEYLDPLPRQLAPLGTEKLHWVAGLSYDVECNWKVFVDNYLDGGYHVNSVHPALAGITDYTRYRTEVSAFTSSQISPLRPAGADGDAAVVGQVRAGDCAYYCWAFPNVMLNVYEGYMDTNLVLPLGPARCRVVYDFYFGRVEGPAARRHIEESIAVAHQIQLEDGGICAEVQRGLSSRTFDTGRYAVRREGAVFAFHRLLARHLGAAVD
jgi:choline monooxygenase